MRIWQGALTLWNRARSGLSVSDDRGEMTAQRTSRHTGSFAEERAETGLSGPTLLGRRAGPGTMRKAYSFPSKRLQAV